MVPAVRPRRSSAALLLALAASAAARHAPAQTRARGVNLHSAIGPEVDSVAAMHMSWVRMDLTWRSVETANGVYFWDDLDRMVQAYRSRGLNIYANLGWTPIWACRMGVPPIEGTCVPQEGYFGSFASAVATRYRGAIAVYGIWNEPDEAAFFSGEPLSYVDSLLVPAATAIREADPFAKIAAPELSGSWGATRAPSAFFDAIAQRGAAGLVDIVSQHVYEEGALKGPDGILHKFFDGDTFHRSLLYWIDRSVLATRPVWITEFGFAGGGDSGGGNDVLRLFQLFAPRPRVTALFDYELVDCGACATPGLGLLRPDLSWKPGATVLADDLGDLDPLPPSFQDHFDAPWSAVLWRWLFPNGGGSVAGGRLVNSVPDFRAKVQDLVVSDFEISSTVRIADDLGNGFNWIGLAGRTRTAPDGGTESGYLAYLRANGDVGLFCAKSGLDVSVRSGRDPKAAPVRLTLSGSGDRIAVSVEGVEFLVARDGSWTSGYVGLQNRSLGAHDDVVVRTSPAQELPGRASVGAFGPLAPVQRRPP
ncbi:MAG TPA: hypothetical protein VMN04_06565 [Thermoanaerobaculia bacterium]|nr:hypothetical protein [Thermoanaerobaculia bacterium]